MKIEFEAKIIKINKDDIRDKLKELGATQVFPERLFTRITFDNPELKAKNWWLRLRDEGDKITLTLKGVSNTTSIEGTTEMSIIVNNLEEATNLLETLGFKQQNFQQNYREEWKLGEVIFDIDTWPMIDPYLEIEAPNEAMVKEFFSKLGFDYNKAVFGSSDVVYQDFYGMDILSMERLIF